MTKETVCGRPVFLRKTKYGWQVIWGRTVIANCQTWQMAVEETMKLMGSEKE